MNGAPPRRPFRLRLTLLPALQLVVCVLLWLGLAYLWGTTADAGLKLACLFGLVAGPLVGLWLAIRRRPSAAGAGGHLLPEGAAASASGEEHGEGAAGLLQGVAIAP